MPTIPTDHGSGCNWSGVASLPALPDLHPRGPQRQTSQAEVVQVVDESRVLLGEFIGWGFSFLHTSDPYRWERNLLGFFFVDTLAQGIPFASMVCV